MTTSFGKYQKEVQHLLHVMKIDFNSLSFSRFGSIDELVADKEGFKQFETARNFFEKTFGWEMARVGIYIFMVKKTSKGVIYIEVEVA